MGYSKLKHEIEMLELKHRHEMEVIKLKHEAELNELKKDCNHKFEDGTSAKTFTGTQWSEIYTCKICGKTSS